MIGGTTILGWFWSFNANAEQKGFELSRNGYSVEIQDSYDGGNSQRRGANKRGSTSVRLRSWPLRDCAITRKYACSSIVWKTLLRTQIFLWVGKRSTTTADQTRDGNYMQTDKYVPFVFPGLSSSSSTTTFEHRQYRISSATERSDEPTPGNSGETNTITQNQNNKRDDNRDSDESFARSSWMVGGVHRQSWGNRDACASTHFSGLRFGTSYESGIKIKEPQYLYSLPKRPKLRSMLANQNYKGSLQKTHWWSSASRRKVWWLDNSWSRSTPRWRWITEQSSIRCRGAGFRHPKDSILSVHNKNFSGDGKEFTKVSRTITEAKGCFFWQYISVWHILWRNYHRITELPHLIDPGHMVLLRENYAEEKKERQQYCYNRALTKNVGLILWNAIAIWEMSKTSWQMGKLPMKDDSENHSKDQ